MLLDFLSRPDSGVVLSSYLMNKKQKWGRNACFFHSTCSIEITSPLPRARTFRDLNFLGKPYPFRGHVFLSLDFASLAGDRDRGQNS